MVGSSRLFEFEMRNPTVRALRDLLRTELDALPESITRRFYRQRQRPPKDRQGAIDETGRVGSGQVRPGAMLIAGRNPRTHADAEP